MREKIILKIAVFFTVAFLTTNVLGQKTREIEYSVFNPSNMDKEYFISTNSGILKTPYGIKIGYISNPGIYMGFRYGKGKEWEYGQESKSTNLYSIVVGLTKPLIIKNDFSLVAELGLGYGQWWDDRRVSWTKSGIELEGGLMMKKKHFLLSLTGNWLNGGRTYSTGDLCLGVGYVF